MPHMKAVQIHRFGDESVMQYEDVPIPTPGPREILIKMQATSVNQSDLFVRQQGNLHIGPGDLPLILGRELAGIVSEVGSNVHEYVPGQRVVALPAVQTRAAGTPGGKEYMGCYAEYVLARPQDTRPLPDSIDMVTGGATAFVSLTAWFVLRAGNLKEGESLLVQSGGSGLGIVAIQLAKHMKAKVITTAGTAEKCARVLEVGADAAINYRHDNFEDEVHKLTDGRGVDLLLETVGGEMYVKSLKVLAPGGRIIALGSSSGGAPVLSEELPPGRIQRRFSVTSTLMENPRAIEQLDRIFELLQSGQLKVVIDRVFPLSDVVAAHRYIAERRNFGKVVLTM